MNDLRELYQEIILDHYKKPRNFREMEAPDCRVDGYNPLCGDRLTLFLKLDGDRVADVSFKGTGCAISTASASIMTETLMGKTREEAEVLFRTFHDLVTGKTEGDADLEELGSMAVLAGVREFPARVKCATLAWHTLHSALDTRGPEVPGAPKDSGPRPVSTE